MSSATSGCRPRDWLVRPTSEVRPASGTVEVDGSGRAWSASSPWSSKKRGCAQQAALLERIRGLKAEHPFWGYRRIWAYLRYVDGLIVNQ